MKIEPEIVMKCSRRTKAQTCRRRRRRRQDNYHYGQGLMFHK